ncbi:unnamed protein product [Danaus chrysippus]|uniref:(African queen) hypothetical protein n=1 Tax=Danaus chrysippus TaxID=151541 RepID=A0A8J2R3I8_9NEOP|nr:unnamed protein product [Danaus chrysippus]
MWHAPSTAFRSPERAPELEPEPPNPQPRATPPTDDTTQASDALGSRRNRKELNDPEAIVSPDLIYEAHAY